MRRWSPTPLPTADDLAPLAALAEEYGQQLANPEEYAALAIEFPALA